MTVVAITPVERTTPLIVDLDGTLIKSDLLVEAVFRRAGKDPASVFSLLLALLKGKAHFKDVVAQAGHLDPVSLPYDEAVLGRIQGALTAGRPVYLVSASNERFVSAIADHFGFFAGWFGSDAITNLSGPNKARLLVETFGERGFDYIGNDHADKHVWGVASKRIGIRTPARMNKELTLLGVEVIDSPKSTLATWLKLLRIHHYAKNALVFLPLLAAHKFDPGSLLESVLAALAFSLCASSAYILNDLFDLSADRGHPSKKYRPLAAGDIPISHAIIVMAILFLCSTALAAFVSLPFLAVLLFYFALTNAYTCWFKKKMLVDVVALAVMYTLRVIGGAAAIGVSVSEWILAFSMFMFVALALIKRYQELATRLDQALPDPSNRNYKVGDLEIIASLAAAAGFNAVTVFALYISSETVHRLYRHPQFLWLICPLLIYWIARVLTMAHRRHMHDDPIVFALKDRVSFITAACIGFVLLVAI